TLTDYQVFRDGIEYNGWDVLDGEIGSSRTNEPLVNAFGEEDDYFSPDPEFEIYWTEHTVYQIAELADLTEGELNALMVYLYTPYEGKKLRAKDAAAELSKLEGKTVSPAAYRRRISDTLAKVRVVYNPKDGKASGEPV